MKRLIIRISALAGVLAIGCIAIAWAQRGDDQSPPTIESKVKIVMTDRVSEKLGETKPASNEILPPKPLPPKPLPPKPLPPKPLPPKSLPAAQIPPPLLVLPSSDPNPLQEPGTREKPAASSGSSTIQFANADPRLADQFGMQAHGNPTPSAGRGGPPLAAPISSAAPRPLTSKQVAAAPLEATNHTPKKTISTIPDRYATKNRLPPNQGRLAAPLQNTIPRPTLQTTGRTDTLADGPGITADASGITAEGTGTPARDRRLDGAQSPQLTIEKFAPQEIQVGNPANFRVVVQNTGTTTARGVEVRDQVPKGTRLMATNPRASRGVSGELVWVLGDMKPGEEKMVEAKLMPLSEGEIGSVATVHFNASASVRTKATKAELVIQTSMPKFVTIGEEVKLIITVSNPGSGVARGVVIEEQVPAGLQHPAGTELEYEIGDLAPNQSRTFELKLAAARPGKVTNVLVARTKSGLQTTEKLPLEVIAPQLKLAISGPKHRFLERKTTYKLSVSNHGTAPARNVKLQAKLPAGMRFISTNHNGHYDSKTKTVAWALAELPVNETGIVLLSAMPEEIGEQKLIYRGTAEGALSVEEQKQIIVDGISAIRFDVVDVEDPVEVGGETIYEIRVVNQGTKASNNIRLEVTLPLSMQLLNAEGPGGIRSNVVGNRVIFEPLRRLSPKVDTTYQIRVRCAEAGDQRISVQLQTDDMQSPVIKEESTRVFSDD